MNKRTLRKIITLALLGSSSATLNCFAQSFLDNFDTDTTANWAVNKSHADNFASFNWDYGANAGIPSAPRSSGGTTRGLRLQSNPSAGVFSGLSVSPIGQSFTGDYTLRFDWWLNFNGPFPAGGSGSTQVGSAGLGTAGTTAQWAGGVQDSVWFAASTDGNSSVDYRAYSSAAATGYLPDSGVFAAGTASNARNHDHTHYAQFGGHTAPAAQVALFPGQTGTTMIGALGMAWRDVTITKAGNLITFTIDGLKIAEVNASTVTLGGNNIFLGHFDSNAPSSSGVDDMIFSLVDNVTVTPVPEPATYATVFSLLAGAGGVYLRRRKK